MRNEDWDIGRDAVYNIWREEGLQVPCKQPKKRRLWLNDGSCIRMRSQFKNHVWSYDFVHDRTHDGKPFRILNIIDVLVNAMEATQAAGPVGGAIRRAHRKASWHVHSW